MKCINCQTENKDTAKFCRGCGAALTAIGAVQQPEPSIKSCPGCQNDCKPDAKFCPKCGYSFVSTVVVPEAAPTPVSIEQPEQVENKIAAKPAEEIKLCPGCGNSLKLAAKFCGKCGFDFEPAQSVQRVELTPPKSQSVRPVEAIAHAVQSAAVPTKEVVSAPPELIADVPEIKEPNVLLKPVPMQPVAAKKIAHQETNAPEQAAKSYVVPIIATLLVCLIGGGAYWWFKLRQIEPAATADAAAPALAIPAPTPAVVPVSSSPEATSDAAGTALVAPKPVPVMVPEPANPSVAKTAPIPAVPAPVAKPTKELKPQANKNGETNDDRKLLNAIDQYLDKQK